MEAGGVGSGDVPRGVMGSFTMEAPKFSGEGSGFDRFLADLDTFYTFHNFNDDLKLRFLPLCLTGYARDAFEAISRDERDTYSRAVSALRRSFVKPCALDAHSRLQQLKFDPSTPLDPFVIELRKLVAQAFPGSVCDPVLFHSFLTALPRDYQQQVIAAGIETFTEAVEKVGHILRSERVQAPVRQVRQTGERSVLEQVLQRLEQLELQVARAAPPAAREPGRTRDGARRGRTERGPPGGRRSDGDRPGQGSRACFACGSEMHLRAACPHRRSRCYKCGRDGHISRVCDQENGAGDTVSRSAPQCPQRRQQ